jgi:hypothetical protein
VISSLAKQLEIHPFCRSYTSYGVWPRDHYMPLQRFTMGRMSDLANVVCGTIAMLKFPRVVCGTTAPLAPCEPKGVTTPIPHSSEQGTVSTASLISKQVVPYRTCGDTYCPWVSTPKTRSLAVLSKTLVKPQHRTSPRSPHITMDGRPTLSTLNMSQTQHHKGKTCMTTQDYMAKQHY